MSQAIPIIKIVWLIRIKTVEVEYFEIVLSEELQVHRMTQQEAQGLGALLDKMEDNDHIKLDNIEI